MGDAANTQLIHDLPDDLSAVTRTLSVLVSYRRTRKRLTSLVLVVLRDASTAAVEHALWTLSFFPVTWLMITGTQARCSLRVSVGASKREFQQLTTKLDYAPSAKCSIGVWFDSLVKLTGLNTVLFMNCTTYATTRH